MSREKRERRKALVELDLKKVRELFNAENVNHPLDGDASRVSALFFVFSVERKVTITKEVAQKVLNIANYLLELGADVNGQIVGELRRDGAYPLMEALDCEWYLPFAKTLIRKKAKVDIEADGCGPLERLIDTIDPNGFIESVQELYNISHNKDDGNRALYAEMLSTLDALLVRSGVEVKNKNEKEFEGLKTRQGLLRSARDAEKKALGGGKRKRRRDDGWWRNFVEGLGGGASRS